MTVSETKRASIMKKNLEQAAKAAGWLGKSYNKCRDFDFSKPLSEAQLEVVENLSSRFARLADLLVNKLFRSIDEFELEPQKSVIDVIRRSAKRGFATEATLRELKELRNAIAHDYAEEDLTELFEAIRNATPKLLEVFAKAETYVKKLR